MPTSPTAPPLPYPVWSRVRNTRTNQQGIVRRTEVTGTAWWVHVEHQDGVTWWLASLCEAA